MVIRKKCTTVPLMLCRDASFASSVVCPSCSFPDFDAEPLSVYSSSVPLTVACFLAKGGVVKHLNVLRVGKSCAQVWEGRVKACTGMLAL